MVEALRSFIENRRFPYFFVSDPGFEKKKKRKKEAVICPYCKKKIEFFPKKQDWHIIKIRCLCSHSFILIKDSKENIEIIKSRQ